MRRTAPALKPNCRLPSRRTRLRLLAPHHHLVLNHLELFVVPHPFAPLLPLDPSQPAHRRLANRLASDRLHADSRRPLLQPTRPVCGSGIQRCYSLHALSDLPALRTPPRTSRVRRCTIRRSLNLRADAPHPRPPPCPRRDCP